MRAELDLLEEKRLGDRTKKCNLQAAKCKVLQQQGQGAEIQSWKFNLEKGIPQQQRRAKQRTLAPTWKGPYKITTVLKNGAYEHQNTEGLSLAHLWNAEHLKKYYQ
ncbi:Uncharacterized protein Adt_20185 [Abeliophyllum distichum]|uniref:Reverse transcriptase n=1 Tax=Abeliophyllum distichum TaxID=126358 RepID=A0ABD1SVU8_9LAMI